MPELWLPIKDIPAEGREFSFSDPDIWAGPCAEFGLECAVRQPLKAVLQILPQEEGVLLRGRITGEVALPCDRCAEDAVVAVDQRFDEFEAMPEEEEPPAGAGKRRGPRHAQGHGQERDSQPEAEESPLLRQSKGQLELNVGALFWEQFLLALPVKPLCREVCKGLCPQCGQDLNQGLCGCPEDEGDPRMAPLRNMKLS